MAQVLSVNVGDARSNNHTDIGVSGIDKRPTPAAVDVRPPGPKGTGGSGLAGDQVCDRRHHGGDDQAVYAYAREDLDCWERSLDRVLPSGVFGENLTTTGVDVTGALIGERWRIGTGLLLEVADPRIPCRTFAGWMRESRWLKTFMAAARPGAYLRVIEPGTVRAGDTVSIVYRPGHAVTIGLAFRALTLEPALLPELLAAGALPEEAKTHARRRVPVTVDDDP